MIQHLKHNNFIEKFKKKKKKESEKKIPKLKPWNICPLFAFNLMEMLDDTSINWNEGDKGYQKLTNILIKHISCPSKETDN